MSEEQHNSSICKLATDFYFLVQKFQIWTPNFKIIFLTLYGDRIQTSSFSPSDFLTAELFHSWVTKDYLTHLWKQIQYKTVTTENRTWKAGDTQSHSTLALPPHTVQGRVPNSGAKSQVCTGCASPELKAREAAAATAASLNFYVVCLPHLSNKVRYS